MRKSFLVFIISLFILTFHVSATTPDPSDAAALAILPFAMGFPLLYCLFMIVSSVISLLIFVLWIFMLIDVITRDAKDFPDSTSSDPKLIWLLIVLLTGWLGSLIYYFMIYRKVKKNK